MTAGLLSSEISNCSSDWGSTAYPPGLVLEPALIVVIPSFNTLSRNFSDSRVESDNSTSSSNNRYAQRSCTSSLSDISTFGASPPENGLSRGKEMEYFVFQYFLSR